MTDKQNNKQAKLIATVNGSSGADGAETTKKAKTAGKKTKSAENEEEVPVAPQPADVKTAAATGKAAQKKAPGRNKAAGSKAGAAEDIVENIIEQQPNGRNKDKESNAAVTAQEGPKSGQNTKKGIENTEERAVKDEPVVVDKPVKAKKASKNTPAPVKQKEVGAKGKPAEKKKPGKKTSPVNEAQAALAVKATKKGKAVTEKNNEAPVEENAKPDAPAMAVITLQVRFHTKFGQALFISGAHEIFGGNDVAKALPMQYVNAGLWSVTVEVDRNTVPAAGIVYNYFIKYEDGVVSFDWGNDKVLTPETIKTQQTLIIDSWNFAGYYENAFYTEPFKQVLLKQNYTPVNAAVGGSVTHILKVKAPLLAKGQTLAVTGSTAEFGNWTEEKVVPLAKDRDGDFYTAGINLAMASFPVAYKYVVFDIAAKKIVGFEGGENRTLYNAAAPGRQTIVNDGFAVLPANTWKGAGVAIPVFSLRSSNSGGVGEFADINLLVDWAKKTGLRLVQLLPVNDTTATQTWTDSYPYAAISAFALHPMYLRLENMVDEGNKSILTGTADEKARLNKLDTVDYEAVNRLKWNIIKQVYPLQKNALFASDGYKQFFHQNSHWLKPYAAFCYLRDKYNSADFNTWPLHKNYVAKDIEVLLDEASPEYHDIAIHFFVQYHLHVQLKQAAQYAHENGVIVKGDIPIGVYRYGADAWQNPRLYHIDMQAGAPPDDFAVTGQNWGFPTYNWDEMRNDGFAWWKQRLEQMSYYFDAFRIDHILGFFRIWSIPATQVEGIMGHFEPSIPVYKSEFGEKGIWFDYNRYCTPYITDKVLNDNFGDQQNYVRHHFLNYNGVGGYGFKPEYATQKQLENYFSWQQDNTHNRWLKQALYNLLSNVILFEAEGSGGQQFHFRFGMDGTSSFKNLDANTQNQLRGLYINYYFRRQDDFWKKKALQTLPALKRVTNMLVCGEDLGLVPACVPEVMRQLGLLSLEIQRMPKDPKKEFFHPADAPYLSVVTPSTHDMSTIRGWWEEDRHKTQKFYNNELGQWGAAPHFCDAWINKLIVVQHLHSPAMWSIFQLQDLLGMDKGIRKDEPHQDRINVPAIPKYYWRYRMHLTLEQLIEADSFNEELLKNVKASGRG